MDKDIDDIDIEESNSDNDNGILFQKATIAKKTPSDTQGPPLAPPSNLIWQEGAIVECFELAVQSHDNSNCGRSWKAKPLFATNDAQDPSRKKKDDPSHNSLAGWEPQSLQLPVWAVASLTQRK